MADLYIALFDSIVADPDKTGHGWEGFYFGENGEHSWYELSRAIGEAMVALKLTDDPEPAPFSDDELVKYFTSVVRFPLRCCPFGCRVLIGGTGNWKLLGHELACAGEPFARPRLEPQIHARGYDQEH